MVSWWWDGGGMVVGWWERGVVVWWVGRLVGMIEWWVGVAVGWCLKRDPPAKGARGGVSSSDHKVHDHVPQLFIAHHLAVVLRRVKKPER